MEPRHLVLKRPHFIRSAHVLSVMCTLFAAGIVMKENGRLYVFLFNLITSHFKLIIFIYFIFLFLYLCFKLKI